MRLIPILTLLIAPVLITLSCAQIERIIKPPKVVIESFRLGEIHDTGITLITRITATNPNDYSIAMQKLEYSMSLNDRHIFTGRAQTDGNLPPKKAISIDMPVTLTLENLNFFVDSLITDKAVNYSISSKAYITGFVIPVTSKGRISLPEVDIKGLSVNSASLSNLDMSLKLSVTNKNTFSLPLRGLSYRVSSDGTDLLQNEIKISTIEKNSTTDLNLPVRINPTNLISSRLQLIDKPNITIEVNAMLELNFLRLPLSIKKQINLKEYID